MIEIIQGENWDDAEEKRGLPKDIKQMGTLDTGDRIYIESNAYQKMHTYSKSLEKMVYIMLGCFDDFSGSTCIFVEDVIKMNEVEFNGKLPVWNDESWGYLYRKLRPEHENMIIVGWAIDICGQIPSMTAQLERVHQTYFGGIHQILLLMDTLEREEAFFSNRNGYLKRREGFFIYYDKSIPERMSFIENDSIANGSIENVFSANSFIENGFSTNTSAIDNSSLNDSMIDMEVKEAEKLHKNKKEKVRESARQQNYRDYLNQNPVHKKSYSPTMLLLVVIVALGYSAFRNYEKMEHMELALNQMGGYQTVMQNEVENDEQVKVEEIVGTITPIQTTETQQVTETQEQTAETNEDSSNSQPTSSTQNAQNEITQADNSTQTSVQATEQTSSLQESVLQETVSQNISTQETAQTLSEAETYLAQGYYVVQQGDNLAGICRKIYHTTAILQQLCQINEIENPDAIYVGQHLKLPN